MVQSGLSLPMEVRVRTPAGYALKSFQLQIGPLDTTVLSSGAGASYTDFGSFSGVVEQLNDPASLAVLAASDEAWNEPTE